MQLSSCYTFKEHTYTDGFFNSSIDATYIIHVEGNGRIEAIKKQLEEYHPTNTVYIVFNKGFKNCKKSLKVQNSLYDITHANLEVFKHSKMNNYSNILVLEDDFIFNKDIKIQRHCDNINKFIKDNDSQQFIYHLGALPVIIAPYNSYTYISLCFALHASIFTSRAQDYILEYSVNNSISDWDTFLIGYVRRYVYYVPLCYQTFPETENRSNYPWPDIVRHFVNKCIEYTKFDVQPEPGTTYIYTLSKVLSLFLLIFIVFIMYWLFSYFKIFKKVFNISKGYRLKR